MCIRTFLSTERAVSTTEYAIMLALIVLVAVGAISGIGLAVRDTYFGLDNMGDQDYDLGYGVGWCGRVLSGRARGCKPQG